MKATEHLERLRIDITEYINILQKTILEMKKNGESNSEIRCVASLKIRM